jgi:hypothetical protein
MMSGSIPAVNKDIEQLFLSGRMKLNVIPTPLF